MGGVTIKPKQGKKLFTDNMVENSEDFKQLGTLHREQRQVQYFPQEARINFSSRPQNMKEDFMEVNPELGYFSQNRVPQNLVGNTFKAVR